MRKMILILLLCSLTSCTYIYGDRGFVRNRGTDYLRARCIPPLRIPPGISSSTIESHYPIPDRCYPEQYKEINLSPPELYGCNA